MHPGMPGLPVPATVRDVTKKQVHAPAPARRRPRGTELAHALERLEVLSDEALEIARVGLIDGVRSHRFEVLQAEVLSAWAASVAKAALSDVEVSRDRREEVCAEARLWLIEQLREFDPTPTARPGTPVGSCGAFVRSRQNWFRSVSRRTANGQTISHGRFAVLGAIGSVREEFEARHHRPPTDTELKSRVTERLTTQAREKVLATDDAVRLDDVTLAEEVRRKLSKDGILSALEHFDELRVESRPDLPLQVLDVDDDAPGWGVPVPCVEGPDLDARDEEASFEALLAVALGDRQWARAAFGQRAGDAPSGADAEAEATTLKDLARLAGHSTAELKDTLEAARCRVLAPHAQWAHLAPGL